MHSLNKAGLRAVLMHFRGCGDEPNKTRSSYHSGHTQDIAFVIDTIAQRYPNRAIGSVGFSLGGNALLKYLGNHTNIPLKFAVSISPPLVLIEGATRINTGFSKIYQRTLLNQLGIAFSAKRAKYPALGLDEFDLDKINNFFEFDHLITAPLHGYESGDDYYRKASTQDDLINITTPTHILWSQDDPFFTKACIPTDAQLSEAVDFELTTHGGHVAFVAGNIPLLGKNWLCDRVCGLFKNRLFEDQDNTRSTT